MDQKLGVAVMGTVAAGLFYGAAIGGEAVLQSQKHEARLACQVQLDGTEAQDCISSVERGNGTQAFDFLQFMGAIGLAGSAYQVYKVVKSKTGETGLIQDLGAR